MLFNISGILTKVSLFNAPRSQIKFGMLGVLVLLLSACQSAPQGFPTSPRLEMVRGKRAPVLAAEMESAGFKIGDPVFLRVFKREGRLEAWVKGEDSTIFTPYKSYPICKFSGRLGPKLREGDRQAPEGFYEVGAQQLNPNSKYHLSFNLGFPNEYDAAMGRTGSALMIHGGCKSIGCYAMTDPAIEEIYLMVEASIRGGADVPVHIFPFEMNEMNIYANYDPLWMPFWRNLEEGYKFFELTRVPPAVTTGTGQGEYKYVFQSPGTYAENVYN